MEQWGPFLKGFSKGNITLKLIFKLRGIFKALLGETTIRFKGAGIKSPKTSPKLGFWARGTFGPPLTWGGVIYTPHKGFFRGALYRRQGGV